MVAADVVDDFCGFRYCFFAGSCCRSNALVAVLVVSMSLLLCTSIFRLLFPVALVMVCQRRKITVAGSLKLMFMISLFPNDHSCGFASRCVPLWPPTTGGAGLAAAKSSSHGEGLETHHQRQGQATSHVGEPCSEIQLPRWFDTSPGMSRVRGPV